MNYNENEKFENINDLNKYESCSISKYDERINSLTKYLDSLVKNSKCLKYNTNLNNTKFIELKNVISDRFKIVLNELNEVIENVSNKNNNNGKEEIEESPASIKKCLNLNWREHERATGSIVDNSGEYLNNSHWHVESEEILSGVFTARIRLNKYTSNSNNWTCAIGMIRADEKIKTNGYYNHSVVLLNDCSIVDKFSGSETRRKILNGRVWTEGDEIIIKRDNNDSVYFGMNDEQSCEFAYNGIAGDYRIVIGFINHESKNDLFELVYLL